MLSHQKNDASLQNHIFVHFYVLLQLVHVLCCLCMFIYMLDIWFADSCIFLLFPFVNCCGITESPLSSIEDSETKYSEKLRKNAVTLLVQAVPQRTLILLRKIGTSFEVQSLLKIYFQQTKKGVLWKEYILSEVKYEMENIKTFIWQNVFEPTFKCICLTRIAIEHMQMTHRITVKFPGSKLHSFLHVLFNSSATVF